VIVAAAVAESASQSSGGTNGMGRRSARLGVVSRSSNLMSAI
jgi:hypothetical protein